VHTAEGISIRFPRVTRIRRDKDWTTATTLNELRGLFKKKPESIDFDLLLGACTEDMPEKRMIDIFPEKLRIHAKKETSPLNQSMSFKEELSNIPELKKESSIQMIKEESQSTPGRFCKKRKGDERDESPKKIVKQEGLEKKKLKVMRHEIKQETEDVLLVRIKNETLEDNKQESRSRHFDHLIDDDVDTEKCFEFSTDFDSNVEDNVSNAL
jgi:DNA ligase-3